MFHPLKYGKVTLFILLFFPCAFGQLLYNDLSTYCDQNEKGDFPNSHVNRKILEVLLYNFKWTRPPITARLITYESHKNGIEFDWNLVSCWPKLSGNKRPIVPSLDPRRLGVGNPGATEVYRYVIIIWLFDERAIKELRKNIMDTFNRRWDRIVLIGPESIVSKMWATYEFQDLKEKTAVVYETGEIWIDPFVYDNGNKEKIKSMSEKRELITKMGANLRGRHLKVAGCEWPPWIFKKSGEVGSEILAGNHYNIIKAASTIFNYTFETAYWGADYGAHLENDTWIGMYAGVFYPKFGYHLTFFLSHDIVWSYGVDYPSTITTADIIFVTGHPRTEIPWNAFMLPFTETVWVWTICSFVILGVVQGFIMWLREGRQWKYIVYDSAVFLPYAMATEQGLCDIPNGARLTCLVWLLGCTVLGTGYRSTLRANIAFPKPEAVPTTYEELGNRPDYFTTLHTQGAVETTYIKETKAPPVVKIRRTIKFEKDEEKCLYNTILTRKTACITWSPFIEQVIARSFTKNSKVDPLLYSSNAAKRVTMSLAFQKNSMFVDSFFGITAGTAESGILRKWELEVNQDFKDMGVLKIRGMKGTALYNELQRLENHDDGDKPLTTDNLKIVFAILPLGFALSVPLFGIEKLHWSYKTNKPLWTRVWNKYIFWKRNIFKRTNSPSRIRVNPRSTDSAASGTTLISAHSSSSGYFLSNSGNVVKETHKKKVQAEVYRGDSGSGNQLQKRIAHKQNPQIPPTPSYRDSLGQV